MITIGIDTGIATMGIAAADENGRILFVHFSGTAKANGSVTEDIDRRVRAQAKNLYAVIPRYRTDRNVAAAVRIVKEERSTNGKFSATSKMQQSASAAMVVTLAMLEDFDLVSVSPKVWQRRMLGIGPKDPNDYKAVSAAIVDHIYRSGAGTWLNRINESQRSHAIDAAGMAIYGALYWHEIKKD